MFLDFNPNDKAIINIDTAAKNVKKIVKLLSVWSRIEPSTDGPIVVPMLEVAVSIPMPIPAS